VIRTGPSAVLPTVKSAGYRVAVDIGGTFTDAVVVMPDGTVRSSKSPSIPGNQDQSVAAGVDLLGLPLDQVDDFIHGTTTALNALLERRGARLAMVVTTGFRDVYEIGRANRPEMYNIQYHRSPMLLRRKDIFEIDERVAADGNVLTAVAEPAVASLAQRIRGDYDAVAVCLINSYRWPDHELQIKGILERELPGVSVVASSDIAPEWREYERFSTTLVSAYVTPEIQNYLGALEERLSAGGLRSPLHVMQSNGGVMTAQTGLKRAVQTLFSGPVGGTVAGETLGKEIGSPHLICVDMGGTSFDVSLVVDGRADIESQIEIEGHPVLTPSVSVHSCGAGGGSVIHVEAGGLRVGPESAGALPGPACYGRGGGRPTITDANVFLGRIPPDARLGGSISLDVGAAERALATVGSQLGLGPEELAVGAIDVANAMMADAIRELTVARGIDPRDFDLVAFGGAGPLHAAALAVELSIARVMVPVRPGVLSAFGMLQANVRHDVVRSYFGRFGDIDLAAMAMGFAELRQHGSALLRSDGIDDEAVMLEGSVDLRYVGQEYTLTIPFGTTVDASTVSDAAEAFHDAYKVRYGHNNPDEALEVVSLRITAVGLRPEIDTPRMSERATPIPKATIQTRFADSAVPTAVYDRTHLGPGSRVAGPAVLLEDGCTTLVPPGWSVALTTVGHMMLGRVE